MPETSPMWSVILKKDLTWEQYLDTTCLLFKDIVCSLGLDPGDYNIFELVPEGTPGAETCTNDGSVEIAYKSIVSEKLENPIKINGVEFDGSKDIQIYSEITGTMIPGKYINGDIFTGDNSTEWNIHGYSGLGLDTITPENENTVVTRDDKGDFRGHWIYAERFIGQFDAQAISVEHPHKAGSYLIGNPFDGSTEETWVVDATPNSVSNKIVARDGTKGFKINNIHFDYSDPTITNPNINITTTDPTIETRINIEGHLYTTKMTSGSYNDVAECFIKLRKNDKLTNRIVEILEDGSGQIVLAGNLSHKVVGVVSDSYGYLLAGTEEEIKLGSKAPVGMIGTVVVDSLEKTNKQYIGCFVVSGGNGKAIPVTNSHNLDGCIVGKIISIPNDYQYKILIVMK